VESNGSWRVGQISPNQTIEHDSTRWTQEESEDLPEVLQWKKTRLSMGELAVN